MASLCCDDGGLDDDGRDDVGDKRDVLKCSGVRFDITDDSDGRLVLCGMWCTGRPFIEMLRKPAKSYGKNGFLHNNSGWANGWNGVGRYPDRTAVPDCGDIIVAAEWMVGGVGGMVGIGLNSPPNVGGNTVDGTVPGNVGDTAMKKKEEKQID